jgi:hypothetical protein
MPELDPDVLIAAPPAVNERLNVVPDELMT